MPTIREEAFLGKSKSKINLMSWIFWNWSYVEENRMDAVFRVYNTDLKSGIYLLDELEAAENGKVSMWVQTLTTTGAGRGTGNCLPI